MNKKRIVLGIVAHVDAGKTTLSEAILYVSGKLRKLGRVDNKDSFLDSNSLERQRGITVFSKQASISLQNTELTLLDTPGHVDFVCETERVFGVLDYAVVVVSGSDIIQPHTETLWKLLQRYQVPCFIFISKMDIAHSDRNDIMSELRAKLSDNCVDFSEFNEDILEQIAMCDEEAMSEYLEEEQISDENISRLISERKLFPCFFGSGLRVDGVEEFLNAVDRFTLMRNYPEAFSATVYKIARDRKDSRLTFLKLTGGNLSAKNVIRYRDRNGQELEEKVDELRLYSGYRFEMSDRVAAGQICAVTGLSATWPGLGLGEAKDLQNPLMEPVMSYTAFFPDGEKPIQVYPKLRILAEEDPQLRIELDRQGNIVFRFMGKVQTEILTELIRDRFQLNIQFESGRVMYRETIADKVEGVGHYEPLKHYAEVHLIMEPTKPGTGIVIDSVCSEDELDRNWQRLILTHILEKNHLGVLTGAPITDIKITLAAGKAHIKHTEGGDFRQATYRAIRQGLMKAKSVLLEPWYDFEIDTPPEQIGRAIGDIKSMHGEFEGPDGVGELMRISGSAPAALIGNYAESLVSYTHGKGRLLLSPGEYRPCRDTETIAAEIGYDPLADLENTPDSVFCSHGAGTVIPWNQVEKYMHLESALRPIRKNASAAVAHNAFASIDDKELESIMLREFGPIRRKEYGGRTVNTAPGAVKQAVHIKEMWIVDGYNLIFSWPALKKAAADSLDLARAELMGILSNFSAYSGCDLILVFDGFRTPGNRGSKTETGKLRTVFTQEGETADCYIENLTSEIGKNYSIKVVTNDSLIQLTALRSGVLRIPSAEFRSEVENKLEEMRSLIRSENVNNRLRLKDCLKILSEEE